MEKALWILGVAAGIGAWAMCAVGMETAQYVAAMISIAALGAADAAQIRKTHKE